MKKINYQKYIQKLKIVNKEGEVVSFIPNEPQTRLIRDMENKNIILKARQLGFSSIILAMFAVDFTLTSNSRSVVISHDKESSQRLLDRVKFYLEQAQKDGMALNLKYDSRNELVNKDKNSTFYIAPAGSKGSIRGDTIHNLHLSEFAHYEKQEQLLASALSSLTPNGKCFIESTANGINYFYEFWNKSKEGATGFKTFFFGNHFYRETFLKQKADELGTTLFNQEFPRTAELSFIHSGTPFFDRNILLEYKPGMRDPIKTFNNYHEFLL